MTPTTTTAAATTLHSRGAPPPSGGRSRGLRAGLVLQRLGGALRQMRTPAEAATPTVASPFAVEAAGEVPAATGPATMLEAPTTASAGGLDDAVWLRRRYQDEGASFLTIAAELGTYGQAVGDALHRHNIATREGTGGRCFPVLGDREALAGLLAAQPDIDSVARSIGCSKRSVRLAMTRLSLAAPRPTPAELRPRALRSRYGHGPVTIAQVARDAGVTRARAAAAIAAAGLGATISAGHPELGDRAWLTERYRAEGVRGIVAALGCSRAAAYDALHAAGIIVPSRRAPRLESRVDVARFVSAAQRGTPVAVLCDRFDLDALSVRRLAVRLGFGAYGPRDRRAVSRLSDQAWLRAAYLGAGRSQSEIAAELGVTQGAVSRALAGFSIPARPRDASRGRHLSDARWLRIQYWRRRRSLVEIAAYLGVSEASVRRAMVAAGVPRRGPGALSHAGHRARQAA